eukprot:106060-Lingulodinium_polyedra.AAC.1
MVALAFATRCGRRVSTFRSSLCEAILASLEVVDAPPPRPDHPWSRKRDNILRDLLGDVPKAK